MYCIPKKDFCENVSDETILLEYSQKTGKIERYTLNEVSDYLNKGAFLPELFNFRVIEEKINFPVTSVSKEDLIIHGFDPSDTEDTTMQELANKLGEDYHEQLFTSSLPIIADALEIPRKKEDLNEWFNSAPTNIKKPACTLLEVFTMKQPIKNAGVN